VTKSFVSSPQRVSWTPLDLAGYNYIDRIYGDRTYAPERERFPHRLCLGTETSSLNPKLDRRADNAFVIGDFHMDGHRLPR